MDVGNSQLDGVVVRYHVQTDVEDSVREDAAGEDLAGSKVVVTNVINFYYPFVFFFNNKFRN